MKAIITQPIVVQQPVAWQQSLKSLITSPEMLLNKLELSPRAIPYAWDKNFPLRVTESYVDRMEKRNPADPLLRQVLSIPEESQLSSFSSPDPLEEKRYNPLPGLLHKFPDRVLLTFTSSCAIHCRYCFRRHFPYAHNNPGKKGWEPVLDYIAQRPNIMEVILSGGDPLMATDDHIDYFLQALAQIPHVRLLRFHTRLPVVLPSRITPGFVQMLSEKPFITSMIYHINHANEINDEIKEGVKQLRQIGITVLNQSVLLQGVNDDITCLTDLSLRLYQAGILPYYINLLDPVSGTDHFFVPREKARSLQRAIRNALPGYLVPRFVQEIPHHASKTPLDCLP